MLPPEIMNYIFTFIQSNTNKIMKEHIRTIETYHLNKESNMYYALCMKKCIFTCTLCNDENIPNCFKLYSIYDNILEFYKYKPYELIFCSEECMDSWGNY
jgi:hypothetical protein